MSYTYAHYTLVLLPLRSGQFRALVLADGTPTAYEDSETEYQAFMDGLYLVSRLSGAATEELQAIWGRPAFSPVRGNLPTAIRAYASAPAVTRQLVGHTA